MPPREVLRYECRVHGPDCYGCAHESVYIDVADEDDEGEEDDDD